jgi:hypothetical protein
MGVTELACVGAELTGQHQKGANWRIPLNVALVNHRSFLSRGHGGLQVVPSLLHTMGTEGFVTRDEVDHSPPSSAKNAWNYTFIPQ